MPWQIESCLPVGGLQSIALSSLQFTEFNQTIRVLFGDFDRMPARCVCQIWADTSNACAVEQTQLALGDTIDLIKIIKHLLRIAANEPKLLIHRQFAH